MDRLLLGYYREEYGWVKTRTKARCHALARGASCSRLGARGLRAPDGCKLSAPKDMEDPNLRLSWQGKNVLFKVQNRPLTLRDVNNGDRSGDVYENKGSIDKMSSEKHDFTQENAPIAR